MEYETTKETKYHNLLRARALKFNYFVLAVGVISEVDKERRQYIKDNPGSKFITMINYNDIYLMVFKRLNEKI